MSKHILITGGGGFVGSHLADSLLNRVTASAFSTISLPRCMAMAGRNTSRRRWS